MHFSLFLLSLNFHAMELHSFFASTHNFTDQLPVTAHVDQCPLSSSVLRVVENIDTLLLQGRRSSIFQTIPMPIKLSFNNPDVVPSVNNFKKIILAMA